MIRNLNEKLEAAPTTAQLAAKDDQLRLQVAELGKARLQLEQAKLVRSHNPTSLCALGLILLLALCNGSYPRPARVTAQYHTPSMQHYDMLQAKIQDLETRLAQVGGSECLLIRPERLVFAARGSRQRADPRH